MQIIKNLKVSSKILVSNIWVPVGFLLSGLLSGGAIILILAIFIGPQLVAATEGISPIIVESVIASTLTKYPLQSLMIIISAILVNGALESFRLKLSHLAVSKKKWVFKESVSSFKSFWPRVTLLVAFNDVAIVFPLIFLLFAQTGVSVFGGVLSSIFGSGAAATLLSVLLVLFARLFGLVLFVVVRIATQYNQYVLFNNNLNLLETIVKSVKLAFIRPKISLMVAFLLAVFGGVSSLLSGLDIFLGFVFTTVIFSPLSQIFMFATIRDEDIQRVIKKIKV